MSKKEDTARFQAAICICALWILFIVLSGCAEPLPTPQPEPKADCSTLQAEHETLLLNYGALKKAKEELSENAKKCNELINSYNTLQTKYAILESYYNNLQAQYTALLPQIGVQNADRDKAMKELSQQYAISANRLRLITNQIDAVRNKNVPLLSTNLTDIEYNAFYKGWALWWGTFNEKDEEDD